MASLTQRQEYSRYYGDFRGVDFSSDHTQVLDQRLAYSVNMYKDYQSGKSGGIETIPGFRRIFDTGGDGIHAIHTFKVNDKTHVLVHAKNKLYRWQQFPLSTNVEIVKTIQIPEKSHVGEDEPYFKIELNNFSPFTKIIKVTNYIGVDMECFYNASIDSHLLKVFDTKDNNLNEGDFITIYYKKATTKDEDVLCDVMADKKSESFAFNNKLYIIDGENYLCYDGERITDVRDNAYIPTTYKNIIPEGENANTGLQYEERNVIQPKFSNTFYGNGSCRKFVLSERYIDDWPEVVVYGTKLKPTEDFTIERDQELNILGVITIYEAPKKPTDAGYPENYAGVEITAKKAYSNSSDAITKCTISAIFDERVFLSGNPDSPNMIYFCGRSNVTGFTDPTYFPATNFVRDGVGDSGITGLIPVADTLMALKGDTQQDGSVYFHSEKATGEDLHPKDYPSSRGLSGIGCLGACINFLDDPVFVSKRGLEGISKLQIASERSIQHRSTLIDAKLVNLGTEALKNAKLEEWNGYLILLVDGKIFMADSRQMYTDEMGVAQYEWYYLEDIGVYDGGWKEYVYDDSLPPELAGVAIHPTPNAVANPENEELEHIDHNKRRFYFRKIDGEAYICKATGAMIGGEFVKATTLKVIDDNLFFGTPNGVICSFNFDMRDENGEMPTKYYNFDGRTIFSGAATKMDSCGIPHLTKNTIKKSTVIKTKAIPSSTVKVKVRTNDKPYEQIARISANRFDFNDLDFADFSFVVQEDTIFSIKEKEKKWVEKQYYIYSDEYCKPLSLFYITYRYVVAGRIK